jgi:hypothetical protein
MPIAAGRWSFQGHFKLLRKPTAPRGSTVEKHDASAPTAATVTDAPTDRVKPRSAL